MKKNGTIIHIPSAEEQHRCKQPIFKFRYPVGTVWQCNTCERQWTLYNYEGLYWV